jgi:hypothetical protein
LDLWSQIDRPFFRGRRAREAAAVEASSTKTRRAGVYGVFLFCDLSNGCNLPKDRKSTSESGAVSDQKIRDMNYFLFSLARD